jgi:hypothetical protein
VFSNREAAMSVHFDRVRGRWIVRWRDNGRQRARRFADEAEALAFDARMTALRPAVKPARPPVIVDQGGV